MELLHLVFVVLVMGVLIGEAAPPQKRQKAGPCVGMDCMHGVLMHGDGMVGDDHKHEDESKIRQEAVEEGMRDKQPSGPKNGMDSLHGVLMHGDENSDTVHMHQKVGPERPAKKAGPGEGMDFLHGVMMHGDNHPGKKHEEEHQQLTQPPLEAKGKAADGPCIGMNCLHGVLMHSDTESGADHAQEHAHDQEKFLEKSGTKFSSPDLESAMHGGYDDSMDHVHSADNKAPISEKHKGVPSISDPHEVIHGHLNGQIKVKTEHDKDQDDYLEWLKTNKNKDKDSNKGGFLGFSFPFISDSLLDNIEILKRRYLPKFWGVSDVTDVPQLAPPGQKNQKKEGVYELLSDVDIVGGTSPVQHHHHHGSLRKESSEKEGSGLKHDEG